MQYNIKNPNGVWSCFVGVAVNPFGHKQTNDSRNNKILVNKNKTVFQQMLAKCHKVKFTSPS
jgi:hypothetical protein